MTFRSEPDQRRCLHCDGPCDDESRYCREGCAQADGWGTEDAREAAFMFEDHEHEDAADDAA